MFSGHGRQKSQWIQKAHWTQKDQGAKKDQRTERAKQKQCSLDTKGAVNKEG